jgi:glyoxylase-like metal-dependent hydrolase (beta-lactamase superfamily II)
MIPPIHHDHGIVTLDADYLRPGLAAIHLIIEQGHVAIVDTGTNQSVPGVLAELKALGLKSSDVDYVIATHVHLDHAGGAGGLMQNCANARLVVHPRGARHLIDPAKLVAGSIAVYGRENFLRLYGDIVPVAAERVMEAEDGFRLDFQGRVLTFLDTPGHARHHFCVHDAKSESVFTGDTFGISYREFDVGGDMGGEAEVRPFIFPTTTPVQFDPMALHATIDRILALEPEAAFLTHYGRVTNLPALAPRLHEFIDEWCELTLAVAGEGQARQAALEAELEKSLMTRLRAHGCTLDDATCRELLANDIHLNAQGLLVWRDQK